MVGNPHRLQPNDMTYLIHGKPNHPRAVRVSEARGAMKRCKYCDRRLVKPQADGSCCTKTTCCGQTGDFVLQLGADEKEANGQASK